MPRQSRRTPRRSSADDINPGHTHIRSVLRRIGPALIIVGVVLLIGSFAMNTEPETGFFENSSKHMKEQSQLWSRRLAIRVPGILCLMLGLATTGFAFQGAVARYKAAEYAPVVTDTANYVARGAKEGIREVSSAIAEGIRNEPRGVKCPACDTGNDADARFCDGCGAAMRTAAECSACGAENDGDAKFCDSCGERLGS